MYDYSTDGNFEFPKIADDDNIISAYREIHTIVLPVGHINTFHITPHHNLFSTPMGQFLVLHYSQDSIVDHLEVTSCLGGQSKTVNGIDTYFIRFCLRTYLRVPALCCLI